MTHDLHPQIQTLLDQFAEMQLEPIARLSVAEARAQAEEGAVRSRAAFGVPEVFSVQDRTTGPQFGEIPVRIYRPTADPVLPVIVYYHGGGHVICSLDTHDMICCNLARETGAAVVSVDYRLAPDAPFPAAVEDSYAATAWVFANGAELGFDLSRSAVLGDSAGGNLAAVVALMARDQDAFQPSAQVLIYPVVDYRAQNPSHETYGTGYGVLEAETVTWFADHYLSCKADESDWRAAPHLATSHVDLPPTLIITAQCDVLRDEGVSYGQQLRDAGVSVKHIEFPGMVHAFFGYLGAVDDASAAHRSVGEFLHRTWG